MKEYRGSRGVAPLVLNLGIRWRRVVDVIPRSLHLQERTPLFIELEVGWALCLI